MQSAAVSSYSNLFHVTGLALAHEEPAYQIQFAVLV